MSDILKTLVTVFPDVTSQCGTDMPLEQFLDDENSRERVLQLRNCQDSDAAAYLKKRLPCATISARCPTGRKETDSFEHTGLICVDIDGKDNPQFPNGEAIKEAVCAVAEVAYCALSASGNGCFAIIRIANPDLHAEHFRAMERLFFQRLDIVIDGQCGNIKRLRFASYDPSPFVNDAAPALLIYDAVKDVKESVADAPARTRPSMATPASSPSINRESDFEKVGRMVGEIVSRRIDITNDYADWVNVGMALTALGEGGRQYFHEVSAVCPKYRQGETDRKFSELLRTTNRVGLGSFFHACREHGVAK